MLSYFKKSLFVLLLLASTPLWANDEHHFIYIQSEKGELFYVRYKGKVLSASAKGYVIVPEIPKGTAQIAVGFPKNEIPEKQFLITLSGTRDEGFVIKHTSAQEIALFNLQTYTLLKPAAAEALAAVTDTPAPAADNTVVNTAAANTTEAATTAANTAPIAPTPAPTAAPVDSTAAMMNNVKKDLDNAFAGNKDVIVGSAPGATPAATTPAATVPAATATTAAAKQPSKFASALDKVVSDDRPADDPVVEPAPAAATTAAPATDSTATAPAPVKKPKKAKPTKDPLTDDEKALLADVLAEEQKTAAATEVATAAPEQATTTPATAPAQTATAPAATPAPADVAPAVTTSPAAVEVSPKKQEEPVATTETPAAAYTETPATEPAAPSKKERKKKHTSGDDPQFIDFNANAPVTSGVATTAAATEAAVDAPSKAERKRKKREAEAIADSTVAAPAEETPKPSRKKKRAAETTDSSTLHADDWVTVNKPATTATVAPEATKPATTEAPALNSDCKQMLNNDSFKKLMKKVAAQSNEYGMVETFNKNIRNTCLSNDQIRAFAQLIDTDDYRYKLLETAYQHTYETGSFVNLQDLLKDDYYRKRFKAMLR